MWELWEVLEEKGIADTYHEYHKMATQACWLLSPHLKKNQKIKPTDFVGTYNEFRQKILESKSKPKPGIEELKEIARKKGLKVPK
jgi:hypothetical protein